MDVIKLVKLFMWCFLVGVYVGEVILVGLGVVILKELGDVIFILCN